MISFSIPSAAQRIINALEAAGFEAYVVGGCVRDSILRREPHDWDICTSATPEEVIDSLRGCHIIETGIKHGTVTVMMEDEPYEVTTFRVDGNYSDNRHPDSVEFVRDIKEDLARRDFTINAMAYNPKTGLIDPFNGRADLERHIIRTVGAAARRFSEDGLRILRALRFASTYGFMIDEETSMTMRTLLFLLDDISAERIRTELSKLLSGENVLNVLLNYADVICRIIPEMCPCVGFDQNNKYHQYTIYGHIAHAVSNYHGDDEAVNVALLLHDIGKPYCYTEDENGGHFHGHAVPSRNIAEDVLNRLKFDNKTKDAVLELVLYHDTVMEPTAKVVRKWLGKLGVERFTQLMDIRLADIQAHAEGTQESRIERRNALLSLMREVLDQEQCFQLRDLAINGRDVMSLGVPEGERVGALLRHTLNMVIEGNIDNDHDALMRYVERLNSHWLEAWNAR